MNDKIAITLILAVICFVTGIGVIIGVAQLYGTKVKEPEVILEKYQYGIACVDGVQYLYGHGHLLPYFSYDKITLTPRVRTCK
jgi:hypothetical protein